MISYDDLVVALAAWRARQGLPVAQPAAPPPPAPPRAAAPPAARPPAPRAAPPPPPAQAPPQDFDDGLVEEGQYASAGDDYVVPLGGDMVDHGGESTAIGAAPEPPSESLTKRGKRNPDW
jgi:hypothetical protein